MGGRAPRDRVKRLGEQASLGCPRDHAALSVPALDPDRKHAVSMAADRRFVVFALGRTGSRTLSRLLQCHHDIRCLNEPFNPTMYEGSYARQPADRHGLDTALEGLWRPYNGIKHVWDPTGWPFLDKGELNEHLLTEGNHRILLLTRRNRLRRLVSLHISLQSGIWFIWDEPTRRKFEEFRFQPIDRTLLGAQLDMEEAAIARHHQLAADCGKPFLEFHYEEIFGDSSVDAKVGRLQEILAFVGATWITDPEALDRARVLLDPKLGAFNSEQVYRRIPGIEHIDDEFGSDETGRLFHRA